MKPTDTTPVTPAKSAVLYPDRRASDAPPAARRLERPFHASYEVMNDRDRFAAAVKGATSRKHVLDRLGLGYGSFPSNKLVDASLLHRITLPAPVWTADDRKENAPTKSVPAPLTVVRDIPVTPFAGRRAAGLSPFDDKEHVEQVVRVSTTTSDAVRRLGLKVCGSTNKRFMDAAQRHGIELPWLTPPADARRGVTYLKSLSDSAIRAALEASDWRTADALRLLEVPPAGGTYRHMAKRRETITPAP